MAIEVVNFNLRVKYTDTSTIATNRVDDKQPTYKFAKFIDNMIKPYIPKTRCVN